ncbi:MAG: endonuclease MutS2 [Oscillospiraceae bacterium]|nr:endonuclease MutS2 [Oscillospiraceae bacterium]
MSDMFDKSMEKLELPRVLDMLAQIAVSDAAKARARNLRPATERGDVLRLQDETEAARELIGVKGSPSFSGVKDVAEALDRADRGGMLNTRELLDIAGLLTAARRASEYIEGAGDRKTVLDQLFASLRPQRYLEDHIRSCILSEDEIADGASAELADIRRHMRAAAAKSRSILQKIISSPSYARILQENLVTERNGRFVVPVKAECRGEMPGLVHDVSSSGATVFIEPLSVVQANNELRELESKEKKEIERILAMLSAEAANGREQTQWNYDILVHLDLIFAKGELAYKMKGMKPELTAGSNIVLRRARHPLLDSAKAVPISVELGRSFDTLVITGPNTGGKTVTLKTIGLLTLMAQCGLQIPADEGSSLGVFERVLADVGDEQSIEQSLSTFSAHMVNIVQIMEQADERSLVLFDELGAGTDPVEGAALAISIIESIRDMGAKVAATTHYAELKTYAMTTIGVENASCEFDVETLRPTYRLLIGVPGKSNAFAISRRLGLAEYVIDRAREQMGADSLRFEDVLTELERKRQALEKEQIEVERLRVQREEDARKAREFREQMEKAKENARKKGESEAKRLLQDARDATDQVFRELKELKKKQEKAVDWQSVNEGRTGMRAQLNALEERIGHRDDEREPIPAPSRPIRAGDKVEIPGVRTAAEVVAVKGDTLELKAGVMKLTAKANEVRLIEEAEMPKPKKPERSIGNPRVIGSVRAASELDIRGMDSLEAEAVVSQYIDGAVMAKLNVVTIIHGKGTGVLRKAVQQMLRKDSRVKSFRLGVYGEGESGVTVVELK